MVLLDTHIWLWWLLGEDNLTPNERSAIDTLAEQKRVAISWVSVWETELLERKGRISLEPDAKTWLRKAVSPNITTILAADVDVVLAQRKLPDTFHNDPADRLITATSILSGYPLATKDGRIRKAGCCPIWEP